MRQTNSNAYNLRRFDDTPAMRTAVDHIECLDLGFIRLTQHHFKLQGLNFWPSTGKLMFDTDARPKKIGLIDLGPIAHDYLAKKGSFRRLSPQPPSTQRSGVITETDFDDPAFPLQTGSFASRLWPAQAHSRASSGSVFL